MCNDVVGCDACAWGKQQPDCTEGMSSYACKATSTMYVVNSVG